MRCNALRCAESRKALHYRGPAVNVASALTSKATDHASRADTVVRTSTNASRSLKLKPGQRVVGYGHLVGTLYRLNDAGQ